MADSFNMGNMKPEMGSTHMVLPITFDYQGGRGEKSRSAKLWAIVLVAVGLVFGIVTIFSKNGIFILNFIKGAIIMYIVAFIVRFFLLKEGDKRREYITLKDKDGILDTREIWGIYDISAQYPYICKFRNGASGLFVRLNKDVVLGKYKESEYDHYEAIADAYNLCGTSNILICHADYMSNIGMDERLEESFKYLEEVDNEDLRDLLTDIYSYQQQQMKQRLTTHDVYVFMWYMSDTSAWNTIKKILNCFMQANYKSFHVLDEASLKSLPKDLFNLKEFSAVSAMLNTFDTKYSSGISEISLVKASGEKAVLGKTMKEKREERELELKRQEMQKSRNRRNNGKAIKKEDINLDEDLDLEDWR